MLLEQFELDAVQPGSSEAVYVDLDPSPGGEGSQIAIIVSRGDVSGPTILVLGAVHGDEYEGPQAIRTAFRSLDPTTLHGTFIGVPVSNVPAFKAGTRISPLDGLNLARVFPGDYSGTPTQRLAHLLSKYLINRCDFLIDLHSSGTHAAMPTLVGYYAHDSETGQKSREAAFAFGAPVVWGHPFVAPGRTMSAATERSIPWLYTECEGAGWLDQHTAALYARGITNVMRVLGMLSGQPEYIPPKHHLFGSGRIEDGLTVNSSGFLLPAVQLLDQVQGGSLLGQVLGLAGEIQEEIYSNTDGILIFMRATPSISQGELAFMVTGNA